MAREGSFPRWRNETLRGEPITTAGSQVVTPIARVTALDWPGGGLAWARPVAVEARDGTRVKRIPIRNLTRWVLVALALATGASLLAFQVSERFNTRKERMQ